jgi:succinyl-diaminopimelate desuccinylase
VNAAIIQGGSAPNVVADRCVVEIDRRIIPGETEPDKVLEPFERLADSIREEHPEVDLSFAIGQWTEAAEVSGDPAIAELCRAAVREETGREPLDTGFTGITDARFYLNERGIPTIILGPGSLGVAHMANESVEIAQLVAAARIYARVFTRFLDGS